MSDIKKIDTIDELKQEFNNLGILYNIESMKFLIKNKKSMAEVALDNPESTLFLIAAGTKEKSVDKAFEIIEYMRKRGITIDILRELCLYQAQDDDFFTGDRGTKLLFEIRKEREQITDEEALKEIMSQVLPLLKNLEQEKRLLETL